MNTFYLKKKNKTVKYRCKELFQIDNNNLLLKECPLHIINQDIIHLKICNKPRLRQYNKDQWVNQVQHSNKEDSQDNLELVLIFLKIQLFLHF